MTMVRTAALAIVLSLGLTPATGIACAWLCVPQNSHHASDSCHGDASGGPGARLAAGHVCDHTVSLAPFVLDAGRALAFAPAALPGPSTIKAGAAVLAVVHSLAPPGGRVPSAPRLASVLRI